MVKRRLISEPIVLSKKKIRNAGLLPFSSFKAPYNDNDYQDFQDSFTNSYAGSVLEKKAEYVIGAGVKPVFKIKNPENMDSKQQTDALKKYNDLKYELISLDNEKHIKLKQKLYDGYIQAKAFGRSCIAFEPYLASGTMIRPKGLKIIHSRDLLVPEISDLDNSVEAIQVRGSDEKITSSGMILIINKPDNPILWNHGYGYSDFMRIVGNAKALRRLQEFDAPEIAESMYAGYGMFIINTEGLSPSAAKTRIQNVLDSLSAGTFNAVGAKKDDITFIPINLDAKVAEIVQLNDMYERTISGNFGVPGAMVGREEDTNMATLFGKIRLFINGPVQADREWLGDIVAEQWYQPMINLINPEALDEIEVSAEFEPIVIEDWKDMIDSLQKLKAAIPAFPDSGLLEIAKLDKYKDDVDEGQKKVDTEKLKQQEQMQKNIQVKQNFQTLLAEYMNKINKKGKKD